MATPAQAPLTDISFSGYADQPSVQGVSFWPRVVSRIIDNIVHLGLHVVALLLTAFVVGIVVAVKGGTDEGIFEKIVQPSALTFLMGLAGGVAYQALSEGLCGSTIGKMLLGQ